MKPKFKAPGTKRLKPKCDIRLSNYALKFNLRRFIKEFVVGLSNVGTDARENKVGWCRLTLSNPR